MRTGWQNDHKDNRLLRKVASAPTLEEISESQHRYASMALQRIREASPEACMPGDVLTLQRTVGNRAVSRTLTTAQVIQRNGGDGDKLKTTAQDILSGAVDIHDAALGLSDQQVALLEAILHMWKNIQDIERVIQQVEAVREAMYPEPIPLEKFIEFQPQYAAPEAQSGQQVIELMAGYSGINIHPLAVTDLISRLKEGLKPASSTGTAARSGDENARDVVSVNVIPPSKGKHAQLAKHFVTYAAGGALPIAIEKFGDTGKESPDILSLRAMQSALIVIDPSGLSQDDIAKVQQSSDGGGGEASLGSISPDRFVCILVPAVFARYLSEEVVKRLKIRFVGKKTSSISHNVRGEGAFRGKDVEIEHPDYETALAQILQSNPDKTLLTHVTRLAGLNIE
ncbi:MAG: hypothetical protein KatS3mg057_1473 [Herpetosiphonaceae bacterium]|nr:MAG: hypothetical protein KatS3mg057_1473 [Herpetosiphonaceae bacterium]